jgi:hypothetical protein
MTCLYCTTVFVQATGIRQGGYWAVMEANTPRGGELHH